MDLPAGTWRQAVSATVQAVEEHPCCWWAGSFIHAEVSADNQAHPAHGVSGQCSVQYRLPSPRADDGGSRKSSVSQL